MSNADDLMAEVLRLQDQVTDIRGEALTPEAAKRAVAEGIKEAMADPAMWSAAVLAIQRHAQTEAGGWLFGGLKVLLSRIGWMLLIGLCVYMLGGWSALVSFVKTGATS